MLKKCALFDCMILQMYTSIYMNSTASKQPGFLLGPNRNILMFKFIEKIEIRHHLYSKQGISLWASILDHQTIGPYSNFLDQWILNCFYCKNFIKQCLFMNSTASKQPEFLFGPNGNILIFKLIEKIETCHYIYSCIRGKHLRPLDHSAILQYLQHSKFSSIFVPDNNIKFAA